MNFSAAAASSLPDHSNAPIIFSSSTLSQTFIMVGFFHHFVAHFLWGCVWFWKMVPPFTGLQGSSLISSASSWIRPSFSANLNPKTPIWSSMGLSSLPAPSEGVLCVLLVNTALSISIFKGIVRAILHVIGIHLSATPSSSDSPEPTSEPFEFRRNPSETCMEEFRSRNPAIRFDTVCSCKRPEHDCAVCLTRFEPDSEINHLPCGHFFHKVCLEKWLDYWNITCPLCRTPLMPEEETSCFW
ncbi:putative E3 ubiquitin-protein ligase XERICO [Vitis vinifera]|uniref:Putative E3 ubiquitin-protein ligase XERICO n=1 Tax=Vitis vinifera TaxID=29760 RepID=A0A438EEW7_VITVI|nr:putative E3 ubiquitin-protein ligase XERICO [Vitis vinifera]